MTRRIVILLLAILFPTVLLAHDRPGPHGGPGVDAGPYFVELVANDGVAEIFVYMDDTMKPASMKGTKATATVLVGQQREVVQLQPDPDEKDGNPLAGKLTLKPGPGTRVVVQLQIPGQPSVSARFAL